MSEVQLGDAEQRAQQPIRRRRAARAHRVGWAVLALIPLAALAGLLGPGPLSRTGRSAGLVALDYERFTRRQGDTDLVLRIRPDPARPDTAQVWISAAYLSALHVRQAVPQPATWTAADDGSVLAFPVRGPDDQVEVRIRLSPDRLGLVRGAIGVPGQEPVEFWQFVYP